MCSRVNSCVLDRVKYLGIRRINSGIPVDSCVMIVPPWLVSVSLLGCWEILNPADILPVEGRRRLGRIRSDLYNLAEFLAASAKSRGNIYRRDLEVTFLK